MHPTANKKPERTGPKRRRYTRQKDREGYLALLGIITEPGTTPCTNCRRHAFCATAPAACKDFEHYFRTGRIRFKDRAPSALLLEEINRS